MIFKSENKSKNDSSRNIFVRGWKYLLCSWEERSAEACFVNLQDSPMHCVSALRLVLPASSSSSLSTLDYTTKKYDFKMQFLH